MKKYMSFALAFLLVATLFTACGRSNISKDPGGMITDSMVTTESTRPSRPDPTMTMPTMDSTESTESSESTESTESTSMPEESEHSMLTDPVNSSAVSQKMS